MEPPSSTLAWKIPWMEEPGGLQSMGLLRVGHDWATSLSLFTFHFHALEKEMATHSSVLAWRIPGTGEPGGLLSLGSHRFGHDWSDLAAFPQMAHHSLTIFKAICITVGFRKISESDPLRFNHHSNLILGWSLPQAWLLICSLWPSSSEQLLFSPSSPGLLPGPDCTSYIVS